MSRSEPERCPISSRRWLRSGISTRERLRPRTSCAASASRRTGPAIVPASRIESTTITPDAIRNNLNTATRSAARMASMSVPWVESISAPRTGPDVRCTGTATETITSPRSLMRSSLDLYPRSARATSP